MKKYRLLFCFFFFAGFSVATFSQAQDSIVMGKAPVKISTEMQKIDGKSYFIHIVEKGQTLFSVSRAYGVKYQDAHLNKDVDKLHAGDTIWLPATAIETSENTEKYYNYYEVSPKETLYSIAKKFNLKESDIIEMNPILSTELIKAGQVIKIPQKEATKIPKKITSESVFDNTKKEDIANTQEDEEMNDSSIVIRDRRSKNSVNIALLMPFYLDQMSHISISKADIEQKKKREYKSFQFIQFYEGILLALSKLEEKGFNVRLKIYDVGENDTIAIKNIFANPDIVDNDFIITLLYQKGFSIAARLAKKNNIFIVNPMSEHISILEGNPYVFKLTPSPESYARSMINYVTKNVTNPNMIVVHSSSSKKQTYYNAFRAGLQKQTMLPYTLFQWEASTAALRSQLANGKKNVVISAYENTGLAEEAYLSRLLNLLVSQKNNLPTLVGSPDFMNYSSIDLNYLQRLNFTFLKNFYLDEANPTHKEFIELYKTTYKTYPDAAFAAVGYDIMLHFVMGLDSKKEKFWENPNLKNNPINLLNPFFFKRLEKQDGFENIRCNFYKLENYKIVPLRREE